MNATGDSVVWTGVRRRGDRRWFPGRLPPEQSAPGPAEVHRRVHPPLPARSASSGLDGPAGQQQDRRSSRRSAPTRSASSSAADHQRPRGRGTRYRIRRDRQPCRRVHRPGATGSDAARWTPRVRPPKASGQERATRRNPRQSPPAHRCDASGAPDQALLLLYPLKNPLQENGGEAIPVVGFAISFPFSEHSTETEYVVNEIWQQQAFEEPDTDEDDDDDDHRAGLGPARGRPARDGTTSAASTRGPRRRSSSRSATRTAPACSPSDQHPGSGDVLRRLHELPRTRGLEMQFARLGDGNGELRVVLTDRRPAGSVQPAGQRHRLHSTGANRHRRGRPGRCQPVRALAAHAAEHRRHRTDAGGPARPVR